MLGKHATLSRNVVFFKTQITLGRPHTSVLKTPGQHDDPLVISISHDVKVNQASLVSSSIRKFLTRCCCCYLTKHRSFDMPMVVLSKMHSGKKEEDDDKRP